MSVNGNLCLLDRNSAEQLRDELVRILSLTAGEGLESHDPLRSAYEAAKMKAEVGEQKRREQTAIAEAKIDKCQARGEEMARQDVPPPLRYG